MAAYSQQWHQCTGIAKGLWLPGVCDGGPSQKYWSSWSFGRTAERTKPIRNGAELSQGTRTAQGSCRFGVTSFIWAAPGRHRSAGSKRHNRSLERLLLEADLAQALSGQQPNGQEQWRMLLFQQFHDILPGTSVPEVFEQAEPQWRQARRLSRQRRDQALAALLPLASKPQPQWWVANLLEIYSSDSGVALRMGFGSV